MSSTALDRPRFRGAPPAPAANWLDRVVTFFAPGLGLARHQARAHLALTGGYTGARRDRRQTESWRTHKLSANAALLGDLPTLRDRTQDLVRNNPLAAGAVNTNVTNVVGTGLVPQAEPDAAHLGITEDEAAAFSAAAEREFALWAGIECDVSRTQTFWQLQDLVLRGQLESGDIFAVLRMMARPGSPYELKLQIFEADQVSNPHHGSDRADLAGGVALDPAGAPLGYWFADTHPGALYGGPVKWSYVPAFGETSGMRQVLHVFRKTRPGQTRGAPYLAPVIEAFKQLGDYAEAELMAAVISAMITVVYSSGDGQSLGDPDPDAAGEPAAAAGDYKFQTGSLLEINAANGSKIEVPQLGRPNAAFDPFVTAVLRQIGVALEIPFEVLVKHFQSSYSASRAALEVAWQYFRRERANLAAQFCQPVWDAFLVEAVARGRLEAPGFFEDASIRAAWSRAVWIGPARISLDPLKENNADRIAVEMGWKTHSQVTAERTGGDWADNARRRAREEQVWPTQGLGAAAPVPPEDEAETTRQLEDA